MTQSRFRKVGTRTIAAESFLSLDVDSYVAPDGTEHERVVVRHPGAVAIVPVLEDRVVLIRQFRAPIGEELLEIPAGKLDIGGEPPERAAARELEEEIGYRAGKLEHLVSFWTTPGFTDERMIVYLATDLTPIANTPHGVEEEHAELVSIPLRELGVRLAAGEFEDAKTIIALEHVARLQP